LSIWTRASADSPANSGLCWRGSTPAADRSACSKTRCLNSCGVSPRTHASPRSPRRTPSRASSSRALILDLLAIHPVADGNGRLARLLTTYELLSKGYGVARYVSLEQRVYESKNAYYASLYESQREWHDGHHSIWPWTSYLARIIADAYDTFEQRVAAAGEITGSKQDRVREYVLHQAPEVFRRRDVERALPDVSTATIRLVLNDLRSVGRIRAEGSGPGAQWHRQ
jgi:hypothetical protein